MAQLARAMLDGSSADGCVAQGALDRFFGQVAKGTPATFGTRCSPFRESRQSTVGLQGPTELAGRRTLLSVSFRPVGRGTGIGDSVRGRRAVQCGQCSPARLDMDGNVTCGDVFRRRNHHFGRIAPAAGAHISEPDSVPRGIRDRVVMSSACVFSSLSLVAALGVACDPTDLPKKP